RMRPVGLKTTLTTSLRGPGKYGAVYRQLCPRHLRYRRRSGWLICYLRGEAETGDGPLARQSMDQFACTGLPNVDSAINPAAGQHSPRRIEGDTRDLVALPFERAATTLERPQQLALDRVAKGYRAIQTAPG